VVTDTDSSIQSELVRQWTAWKQVRAPTAVIDRQSSWVSGPETDRVIRAMLGVTFSTWNRDSPVSTSDDEALALLDELATLPSEVSVIYTNQGYLCKFWSLENREEYASYGWHECLSMAICLAILAHFSDVAADRPATSRATGIWSRRG